MNEIQWEPRSRGAIRMRRALGVLLVLSGCLLAPATTLAAGTEELPTYAMTVWAPETGTSPGDVFAITQDLEGYLWLGTHSGLVRFDGSRFVRWATNVATTGVTIPGPVLALVGARDGSVWVGSGAGVFHVKRDQVRAFTAADGSVGGVTALAEDRQGVIWAGSRRGLFRYSDGRWTAVAKGSGYAGTEVFSLHEDQSGVLWVGSAAGVYRRGADAFELVDAASANVQGFAEDDTGGMWVTDGTDAVRQLTPRRTPTYASTVRRPASGWRLLHDRRGQIWVAAQGGGLLRVRASGSQAPVVERVEYEHRMGGSTRSLFEDREGNIWVGMRSGLLRLSEPLFSSDTPLEGLTHDGVRTMAVSGDGSVWVATGHSVNRFSGGRRATYELPQTLALHSDQRDVMWASTTHGLWKFAGGRFVPVPVAERINWGRVLAIATDANGVLWLCSALKGVMTWNGAALSTFEDEADRGSRACSALYRDRRGRIWVGFGGGGAAVYEGGTIRSFGEKEGLARGTVVAITEDRGGAIWLATSAGLHRLQGGHLTAITQIQAPLADVVPTLVEDDEGFLWLGVNGGAGLIRFHPRGIDKLAANPAAQLDYAAYDSSDGLPQGTLNWQNGVSGVRGGDGRLWLAAGLGVATIDPRLRPRNRSAAPPRIDAVSADGRAVLPTPARVLPSRTSALRIEYGALSLSSASKLRFRYMLEGLKDEWVAAGPSREVAFSDLPAGNYRFRVSSTYDGQWSEAATWNFSIAPAIYRTSRFLTVVALGLMAMLAVAWWLRLRAVRGQYALVFAERARVSREIHDTLLQSLAAIGVELETIAAQLDPAHDPAREGLRRLRRQVGHCLREARESILDLRRNPMKSRTLVESLRDLAANTSNRGVRTEFMMIGGRFAGSAELEIQLFRIAQEAVGNAIKHGRATHVQIVLDVNGGRAVLTVSDNGCGFSLNERDPSPDSGDHLGLQSMRERAVRVRGRLTIASEPGQGTTIEVSAPVSLE